MLGWLLLLVALELPVRVAREIRGFSGRWALFDKERRNS
jgi:hypothetical protein